MKVYFKDEERPSELDPIEAYGMAMDSISDAITYISAIICDVDHDFDKERLGNIVYKLSVILNEEE